MKETSNFAEWLTANLQSRLIKPVDLARGLGIQPSTITRWIKGSRPNRHTMERIREYLSRVPDRILPVIPKVPMEGLSPKPRIAEVFTTEERLIVMRALSAAADRWREHANNEAFASAEVNWAADATLAESIYRMLAK